MRFSTAASFIGVFMTVIAWAAGPAAAFFWNNDDPPPLGTGEIGKCGTTDLVIAIDTTHSMSAAIRDMKREAVRLLDLVSFVSGGEFRLGLISFRDTITVEVDLGSTADPQEARNEVAWAIRRLEAEGGAGGPEASDEALRTAVLGLTAEGRGQIGDFSGDWRANSRILVIITDNLPGGFDDLYVEGVDDVNARELAGQAQDRRVHISSVYVPSSGFQIEPDPRVAEIMRTYPQLTGGVFAITQTSGLGAAEAIADIVDRCGMRPMS